jgi:hypothetical protein
MVYKGDQEVVEFEKDEFEFDEKMIPLMKWNDFEVIDE